MMTLEWLAEEIEKLPFVQLLKTLDTHRVAMDHQQ